MTVTGDVEAFSFLPGSQAMECRTVKKLQTVGPERGCNAQPLNYAPVKVTQIFSGNGKTTHYFR